MKDLLKLFISFAKVGSLTFGGGYAMLPILEREIVEKNNWATKEEIMDYYAIGQCTPGVIAVNSATFIGYKVKGILGGIISTLGVVFPSIVIITIIAAFISNFTELQIVQDAFAGIKVCVCVLIFNTVLSLLNSSVIDKGTLFIFLLILALTLFTNISPIIFVIVAGILGTILKSLKIGGKKK